MRPETKIQLRLILRAASDFWLEAAVLVAADPGSGRRKTAGRPRATRRSF
jgi:hypothetical protein